MKPPAPPASLKAPFRPARWNRTAGFWLALAFCVHPVPTFANIEAAKDIEVVIPLKPSEPMGQFPKVGDDERIAPNYTFTADVQVTEQEDINGVTWVRVGPVTATTGTPDPNLFWSALANTNIYSLTNTANHTGLATLAVKCAWRPQGGGGGQGPAQIEEGRADVVLDLLDSVVHWEIVHSIAPANGEVITFSYKMLDEAGRGLERWNAFGYWPNDAGPVGHVGWHFHENPVPAEWEREVEVTSWGEPARAGIRLDYNDGSSQFRVSDPLTFFTAELKVAGDGVPDAEQVTLGKSLTLMAGFVPESFEPDRIRYTSSYQHEHNFHLLHDSNDNDEFEHDDFARIAGKFNMRLTLHYDTGAAVAVHTSDTKPLEVQFPSYAEIVTEGPTEFFEEKWQTSLGANDEETLQEFGGWILYNSQTLEYETIKAPPGQKFTPEQYENGEVVGIHLGPRPITDPLESTLNPSSPGATYAVGSFHTHPPTTWLSTTVMRLAGASKEDNCKDNEDDVAGVVYDYVPNLNEDAGTTPPLTYIDSGHPVDSAAQLYPSGPDRRSTPNPGTP